MANFLLDFLFAWLQSGDVTPVMWLIAIGLFVYVMTSNYRALRAEVPPLELDDDEQEVGRIRLEWPLLRTHTLLTSRRVVQARHSWWVSKRKNKAVSLDDVHSIVWRRYTNWFLLLAAIFFLNSINPLSLVLLLFGLQSKIYSIRFATPFAEMPYTRVVVTASKRRQLAEMQRFYHAAIDTWSRMIVEKRLASAVVGIGSSLPHRSASAPTIGAENDFRWGPRLLWYVGTVLALAFVQRWRGGHVSIEDAMLGPAYIGATAAAAAGRPRDGAWLALLAPIALFTMKFPGNFAADGGVPAYREYGIIVLVLLGIAAVATGLAKVAPVVAPCAVLLWAVVPWATETGVLLDSSLLATLLLAFGWAAAMSALEVLAPPVSQRLNAMRGLQP